MRTWWLSGGFHLWFRLFQTKPWPGTSVLCQWYHSDLITAWMHTGLGEHISPLQLKMNLAADRLCVLFIFALHQLKLFQISHFWESLCQEICLDRRASVGIENVSPVQSTLLTLGDFLPGYMFDSCSGVCVPSHWPDNHHEANYSHSQLMFSSSGSHGNDSIMQRISMKSVTFGNISLRQELGLCLHQLCPIKLLSHGKGDGKSHVS